MDDDLAVTPTLDDIDNVEVSEVEDLALRREALLAKVTQADGWQELKRVFQERIEGFRTGRWIEGQEFASDAELGAAYRIHKEVAANLQSILHQVESAAEAVRNDKERE